jgi:hypothetical protein
MVSEPELGPGSWTGPFQLQWQRPEATRSGDCIRPSVTLPVTMLLLLLLHLSFSLLVQLKPLSCFSPLRAEGEFDPPVA